MNAAGHLLQMPRSNDDRAKDVEISTVNGF